jgi:hypothetical protein
VETDSDNEHNASSKTTMNYDRLEEDMRKGLDKLKSDMKSDLKKELMLLEANLIEKAEQTAARMVMAKTTIIQQQVQQLVNSKFKQVQQEVQKRKADEAAEKNTTQVEPNHYRSAIAACI